jgi:indole-3-glycerol phosphate synthase/phosphoribosylanthranilate isomerase
MVLNAPRVSFFLSVSLYWQAGTSFMYPDASSRPSFKMGGASPVSFDLKLDKMASHYAEPELKAALHSLLKDSKDPDFDARHMFGYGDPNHTLSKLQEITATVILDYTRYFLEQDVPTPTIQALSEAAEGFCAAHGEVVNLQHVIQSQAPRMALAAEFKRASPSKGRMAPEGVRAAEQGAAYAAAGANIVSVLTEPRWFMGSLQDLTDIRLETNDLLPQRPAILRKDFVVSEYMIAEAAAAGADTILLIVAVLPQHLLTRLIVCARSYGMEPLVEVHADAELEVALQAGAKVIGVNNRNLHTFQMDLSTSERVAENLTTRGLSFVHADGSSERKKLTLCALSGMSTALDVDRYRQVGLGMCLIGESLMRAPDPEAAITSLCLHPDDFAKQTNAGAGGGAYTAGTQLIKVCGITNPEDALVACRAGANLIGVIFAKNSKRRLAASDAKKVVQAVQSFGERQAPVNWNNYPSQDSFSPMLHFVRGANTLASIASQQRPLVVGVFQNQDPKFVRQMVQECGLDLVQLHGSEGMQAAATENCGGVPAIRVVDIAVDPETGETSSSAVATLLETITNDPVAILLDTAIKGNKDGGGTGQAFDWSIAEQVQAAGLPVIIAGGLTAESVQDCVGSIRPFGVDVSSGVEASPGRKDHDKVRDFVQGARTAAREASKGF